MLAAATTCASGQTSVLLTQLADPATTDAARHELLQQAKSDPQLVLELSKVLPDMLLNAPIDTVNAPSDAVLRSEAQLAGALRIESTIPVLASLLARPMWNPGGSISSQMHLQGDPVARALYEMGPAAYAAIAGVLKDGNLQARMRATQILLLADTEESKRILRDHLDAEPDPGLRQSIALNLKRPADK